MVERCLTTFPEGLRGMSRTTISRGSLYSAMYTAANFAKCLLGDLDSPSCGVATAPIRSPEVWSGRPNNLFSNGRVYAKNSVLT